MCGLVIDPGYLNDKGFLKSVGPISRQRLGRELATRGTESRRASARRGERGWWRPGPEVRCMTPGLPVTRRTLAAKPAPCRAEEGGCDWTLIGLGLGGISIEHALGKARRREPSELRGLDEDVRPPLRAARDRKPGGLKRGVSEVVMIGRGEGRRKRKMGRK
ncbi:uncharacterized protein A4U43_C05F18670 [Asparagus officinalis]|uniref:Uncharacterized protein n=1 Tax=Asparagus officinalis TaxID=4686 RepID=A0A5P1EX06_ASPOF|nr:uncharacterized protein A4U43_C05F18670 [Asparagus officinalis]